MKFRERPVLPGDRPQFLEQLPLRERGGQVEGVADPDVARNRLRDQLVPRGQAQLVQHSCLLGQAGADVPPDERRGAAGEVAGGDGEADGWGTDGWGTDGWGTGGWRSHVRFEGSGRGSQGTWRKWGSAKCRNQCRKRAGKLRPTGLTADYRPAHCPSSRTRDFIREGGDGAPVFRPASLPALSAGERNSHIAIPRMSPRRSSRMASDAGIDSLQGSETPIAIPRMAVRTTGCQWASKMSHFFGVIGCRRRGGLDGMLARGSRSDRRRRVDSRRAACVNGLRDECPHFCGFENVSTFSG